MKKIGKEIDLLARYPKAKRDLSKRLENKTDKDRKIAREFGKDFFDGHRSHGYGGFSYNPKYWTDVIKDFVKFYDLQDGSKILDVGCAKGFMLYDFYLFNDTFELSGIDISSYAISNSMNEVKKFLKVADAKKLPYETDEFDLVISINTIHNLDLDECGEALKEISRVSKKNSFITVDAYNNDTEKERMNAWNLTAKTIMSTSEWKEFFKTYNYEGDFYWFIP